MCCDEFPADTCSAHVATSVRTPISATSAEQLHTTSTIVCIEENHSLTVVSIGKRLASTLALVTVCLFHGHSVFHARHSTMYRVGQKTGVFFESLKLPCMFT